MQLTVITKSTGDALIENKIILPQIEEQKQSIKQKSFFCFNLTRIAEQFQIRAFPFIQLEVILYTIISFIIFSLFSPSFCIYSDKVNGLSGVFFRNTRILKNRLSVVLKSCSVICEILSCLSFPDCRCVWMHPYNRWLVFPNLPMSQQDEIIQLMQFYFPNLFIVKSVCTYKKNFLIQVQKSTVFLCGLYKR